MYYFYISSSVSSSKVINKYMNPICTKECLQKIVDGKLQCHCGEDIGDFTWSWLKSNNSTNIRISDDSRDILFHPLYSSGTAVVRGEHAFAQNLHYYWEIKMISNLYGTDVMVGVGTSKIDLSDWKFRFCSMLGIDSQSWGYSYHGNIQHNKLVRKYGSQFGLGSIVGLHLDMCKGTLEYHVNRKPMGIAFSGLKQHDLYPMVSSTAAQSAVRIVCSVSEESTLQMLCLEFVCKSPRLYQKYQEIPGLRRLYENKYFWIVPTNGEGERKRLAELEENLMCPLNYSNFLRKNKKIRTIRWISQHEGDESQESTSSSPIYNLGSDGDSGISEQNIYDDISPSTSESRNVKNKTKVLVCCSDRTDHEHNVFCTDCKFRIQIEEEELSDSS
ncbi:unnamed protein product [Phaedon cochleariae]|uniref:B30.2/SPRY domain-containing protein n=1 Tax=Phaedon cochleariae TaxID=80249 RepID=A0A9N9WZN9_PHACE|nr:unnamed protein product [Phaedon cochleariae]